MGLACQEFCTLWDVPCCTIVHDDWMDSGTDMLEPGMYHAASLG